MIFSCLGGSVAIYRNSIIKALFYRLLLYGNGGTSFDLVVSKLLTDIKWIIKTGNNSSFL